MEYVFIYQTQTDGELVWQIEKIVADNQEQAWEEVEKLFKESDIQNGVIFNKLPLDESDSTTFTPEALQTVLTMNFEVDDVSAERLVKDWFSE